MSAVVDIFKGITGIGTTEAEKKAKKAQKEQSLLLQQQQDAESKRLRKQQERANAGGRMSLLSGTESGVTQTQSTLG